MRPHSPGAKTRPGPAERGDVGRVEPVPVVEPEVPVRTLDSRVGRPRPSQGDSYHPGNRSQLYSQVLHGTSIPPPVPGPVVPHHRPGATPWRPRSRAESHSAWPESGGQGGSANHADRAVLPLELRTVGATPVAAPEVSWPRSRAMRRTESGWPRGGMAASLQACLARTYSDWSTAIMMKSRQPRTVPVVDDAGGGRRGSRAVVSREPWEVLVSRWAIPALGGPGFSACAA